MSERLIKSIRLLKKDTNEIKNYIENKYNIKLNKTDEDKIGMIIADAMLEQSKINEKYYSSKR